MIDIVAHRGASATHRENSPAAWRAAVAAGADAVETDVRVTADGAVVCLHDADLSRLAGRPDAVAAMRAQDLALVHAEGAPAAPPFADALAAVPPTVPLMLDVKDERPAALEALAATLPAPAARPLILALHEAASVRRFAGCGHAILAMVPDPQDAPAFLEAGADRVRLWQRDVAPDHLAAFAARRVPVWVTAGGRGTGFAVGDIDADGLAELARFGIAALLVNDPAATRRLLKELT